MSRRSSLTAVLLFIASVLVPAINAPMAMAAWSRPGFVRSVGGHGEAGVYAWGMEYNPFTDEILVSDYWNFQVRRYDPDTGKEIGAFYRPTAARKGQPYTVAVDPRDGDIYVPEWGDGQRFSGAVGHYAADGTYLNELDITPPTAYNVWTHVDIEGRLWVADSHFWNTASFPPKIRAFSLEGDEAGNPHVPPQVISFGSYGSGPGQLGSDVHGLGTDHEVVDGQLKVQRIYAADAPNRTVHVFDVSDPTSVQWVMDIGGPGNGPGQFTGDLRGLVVDNDADVLYVVDAEASQIEKFDISEDPATGNPSGDHITTWGTEGDGVGQFSDGGREITLDGDGDVWVTDFGHNRFFEFSPSGSLLSTYPEPGRPAPEGFFSQNRDVDVDAAGRIWSADSWNNRFQVHGASGAFIDAWGQRNSHPPYGMDYPRGIAIDPATQRVWVANTREHVIRVYENDGDYLFTIGDGRDSNDPGSFRWPMDIRFWNGKAYVTDYYGRYLKILDAATGTWTDQIELPSRRSPTGVAIDPSNGDVYVASWDSDLVYHYSADGDTLIHQFGGRGTADGQFDTPWGIDVIDGYVYVVDAKLSRIQVFTRAGAFVGKWGGKGKGAFQYDKPSGIAHDAAGNIYIADAGNDRLLVYSHAVAVPSGDGTAPTVSVTQPANNATLPAGTVIVAGAAADAVGVARVDVALQNTTTGRWWNATLARWQPTKAFFLSALTGASATSVSWRFAFVGVDHETTYRAQVRAVDTTGNIRTLAFPTRTFSVS